MKKNSSNPAKVNRSAEPRNKYWNAIQKNVMGNGVATESIIPESVATRFLLISTRAATAMAIMESTNPVPILCRWVIPISDLVTFLAKGMMMWS